MTMLLWHLQIRNLNLMLAKLKDHFINLFGFSSRLTSLDVIPKNLQSHCIRISHANSGQKINILSKVCTCAEMAFLGHLADFILDISIYLPAASFETRNSFKGGWGRGKVGFLCHPLSPYLLFLPL